MTKRKSGSYSRRKGLSFEREIAIRFREIFPDARRQLEYHSRDARGVDLQGTGKWKVQCKKLRAYAPVTRIAEIQCDRKAGDVPVLITAGDNLEPLAVLPLADLLRLIDEHETHRQLTGW